MGCKFMAAKEELHTFCVEKLQALQDPGHHESDGIQQRFEELVVKAGLSDKQASGRGIYWGCVCWDTIQYTVPVPVLVDISSSYKRCLS